MPQISDASNEENTPSGPRLAATTLLILERSDEECQIFILKRQNSGGFLKDAWVFPGGMVEEGDHVPGEDPLLNAAVRETEEEAGLIIDPAHLKHFSWWLTPERERRRFDTHFYVAPYPADQNPCVNQAEAEWGRLMTPSHILELHRQHMAKLMPPTLLTLELIAGLRTMAEVLEKAYLGPVPICPKVVHDLGKRPILALDSSLGLNRTHFEIDEDGWFS